MTRPADGRILGGVCAGLAEHLGLPTRPVRLVALLSTVGGVGPVAYALLWALTPVGAAAGELDGGPGAAPRRPGGSVRLVLVGLALLGVGAALLLDGTPAGRLTVDGGRLLPLLFVGGGAILAWSRLDDVDRPGPLGGPDRRHGLIRVGLGTGLAVAGIVVLVSQAQGVRILWDVAIATLAVLAGLVLVLLPWAVRLWRRYEAEQASRIRETARADIAAHLHDSVLQTLALIQRTNDPQRVTLLARGQERELRTWLYGGIRPSRDTLAAAIREAVDEVEDRHGVPVDLVVTGDRPYDEAAETLVAALREALLNAVRHGAPPVSAYVEVGPRLVEAFVKDRGPGFDVADIPLDRLGVRESILGRMDRHGGSARIRRLEEGTEVCLALPVSDPGRDPDGADAGDVDGVAAGGPGNAAAGADPADPAPDAGPDAAPEPPGRPAHDPVPPPAHDPVPPTRKARS